MITLIGKVLLPNGGAPTGGRLVLDLLANGSNGVDAILGRTVYILPAGGDLALASPAWQVIPNEEISPAGTVYRAQWQLNDLYGYIRPEGELWSLASSPSSLEIGDVVKVGTPTFPASSPTWPVYLTAGIPALNGANANKPYILQDPGEAAVAYVILRNSDGTTYSRAPFASALL